MDHAHEKARSTSCSRALRVERFADHDVSMDTSGINRKRHGVPLDEAMGVFFDPGRIVRYDASGNGVDNRVITVGRVDACPLTVVYSMRGTTALHIVSARKASRHELRSYWTFTAIGKTRRATLDAAHPPRLSEATRARLDALHFDDIDFSDIAESPHDAEWTCAGPLTAETKKQVTLNLDRDVLDYFGDTGKRYQTRINSVLRHYMHVHQVK